jgi:hypothetical protein
LQNLSIGLRVAHQPRCFVSDRVGGLEQNGVSAVLESLVPNQPQAHIFDAGEQSLSLLKLARLGATWA